MRNARGSRHSLANSQKLTIIAQDPSVKSDRNILMAEIDVPAEELLSGPCGYRVHVIDFDASTNTLYKPAVLKPDAKGRYNPFALKKDDKGIELRKRPPGYDRRLLSDPAFHAQNVYAIVMRTLAQFEFALGRRVRWGSDGHQIHIAPHAFADANAYLFPRPIAPFSLATLPGPTNQHDLHVPLARHRCARDHARDPRWAALALSRAVIARSGRLPRRLRRHRGAAVDLLAADVVGRLLDHESPERRTYRQDHLTRDALQKSVLLGLGEQMGQGLSAGRQRALRHSVDLPPGKPYMSMPRFNEEHDRGELLVAAMMNAFLDIWLARLDKIGVVSPGKKDRSLVVEEGARVAGHLLTMAIRALDYCPPTDITFGDYLSALLTIDREVVPDDTKYGYRGALLKNFNRFDIEHATGAESDGTWKRFPTGNKLVFGRTHFDSMLRDKEEVFRFIWENRKALKIDEQRLYRGPVGAAQHPDRARRLHAAGDGRRIYPDHDAGGA